jgi:hypothetical protein
MEGGVEGTTVTNPAGNPGLSEQMNNESHM